MIVCLVVRNEAQAGQRITVKNESFVIGRGEQTHLRIKSRSVSRQHCAILQRDGHVYVKDLQSSNGTIVNDVSLAAGDVCRLFHRDTLRVGKMTFRLSVRDEVTELPDLRDPIEELGSTGTTDGGEFSTMLAEELQGWGAANDSEDTDIAPQGNTETGEFSTDQLDGSPGNRGVAKPPDDKSAGATNTEGPQRLPDRLRPQKASNSRDAAHEALKDLFKR